jgi:hypothetical protein
LPTSSAFTKRVQNNDPGDTNSFGSNDTDLIYATLSGEKNVGPATLESNWAFRNRNFRLQNPTKAYEYIFNTSLITGDRDIIMPILTANDTLVVQNQDQELRNKLIDARLNNLLNIEKSPIVSKSGKFQAIGDGGIAGGSGILQTLRHVVTPQSKIDESGTYYRYKTSSVYAESKAGITVPGLNLTRTAFDPQITFKFTVPNWSLNNMRMYAGLIADQQIHQSNVPYSPDTAAFLFGFGSTDGTFKIFRNIGDGTTVTAPQSLGVNVDQQEHTVRMGFTGQGTFAYLQLDNEEEQVISLELPDPTQNLTLHLEVQNIDVLSVARQLDIYHISIQTDQLTSVIPTPSPLVSGGPLQLFNDPITFANYIDLKIISTPTDPPSGVARLYAKQADTNNDGLFLKLKLNSVVEELRLV